ncbi:MAG TPA: NAD(P)-binding protein [Thermoanaerobaculia bacterium]|nr:NAD(P)-binding protein [Thermoanaerobaculia bacterium]
MTGHCIVCGLGDVGYRVVELLHRLGEQVVVISLQAREERLRTAASFGVRIVTGDARADQNLHEAGLATARLLIAATDQDLVNIEAALDARRIRPDMPVVIRLFDQGLARQLEGTFDLQRALGTSTLAAPSFAAAALGEAVLGTFSFQGTPFVVGRHKASGPLPGLIPLMADDLEDDLLLGRKEDWDRLFSSPRSAEPAREPFLRRIGRSLSRLAAVWKEEPLALRVVFLSLCVILPLTITVFYGLSRSLVDALFLTVTNLHGEVVLPEQAGPEIKLYEVLLMILGSITLATLYSMLTDYVVGSRLRKLLGSRPMPEHGHVVVVGMGNVGLRVVRELTAVGVPVVAVDADADRPFLADVRSSATVVIGDARLNDTLLRAGIAKARAVIAATDDDAVNLGIALAARQSSPGIRTVVRLFDADFARKVESTLGIDAAMGASSIAAPTFVASALFPGVVKAFLIQDRLLVLQQRKAGAEWAGRKPSEVSGARILMRDEERPLAAEEEVLVVLWRKLARPWGASSAPTAAAGGPSSLPEAPRP